MAGTLTMRDVARILKRKMRCNCDMDNWQPEPSTGHSHVCRIHKRADEICNHAGPIPGELDA